VVKNSIYVSIPHRYDTNEWLGIDPETPKEFQFLIGTIQTSVGSEKRLYGRTIVSIPHRYDTNYR